MNTRYWMTVVFAMYLFSQDKDSEVVTITVTPLSEKFEVATSFTNLNVFFCFVHFLFFWKSISDPS